MYNVSVSYTHLDVYKRQRKNRQKTKIMCNIPVLPVAASILEKYKNVAECTGKLLPVLSNQRMNSYLKEIADVCEIHKNLSTHTARHSYATSICLANGVSMENVAKMLGHADTSVTKHYARVLDQNIFKDMQKVNSLSLIHIWPKTAPAQIVARSFFIELKIES